MKEDTGEHLIGTKEGVMKARTIRRKGSKEERWDKTKLDEMRGLPWNPVRRELEEERREVRMDLPGQEEPIHEEPLTEDKKEQGPMERRRFQIKVSDVRRLGATPGCAGCKCTLQGRSGKRPHTEECRKRFDDDLRRVGDPRIVRMEERMADDIKEREDSEDHEQESEGEQGSSSSSSSDSDSDSSEANGGEEKDEEEDQSDHEMISDIRRARKAGGRRWNDDVHRMKKELMDPTMNEIMSVVIDLSLIHI